MDGTEGKASPPDRRVYLDNAATSYPKPERVYREMERFAREVGGSAGRSAHWRAVETGRVVLAARGWIAAVIKAPDPLRIVFTKNATEALNLAILGTVRPGDHVVTTSMEHNSVMRTLAAARGMGVGYSVAECGADGSLDPAVLRERIRLETTLVVMNHASNVTGTILPVAEVAEITAARGARLLVDAAQTAGRIPLDVGSLPIDLLAFTGHKELFGPQGTGGLFVREGVELVPLMYGGTGSRSTELEQPGEVPDRYESGTLNAMGLAGLGEGARFVHETGLDEIRRHDLELTGLLMARLGSIPGIKTYGPDDPGKRIGVVPVTLDGMSPPEAAGLLDSRYGIATRAGLHCAPSAHRTIGTIDTGTLRISISYLNMAGEIEYLADCLEELCGRGARG